MNINYMRFGNGPRTMVILPGLSLRPVTETPQGVINAYEIFSKDFTVYLFDYREEPGENYTIEDMADDAIQAFEELKLSDICLYGVSMGGMVSQILALKRPDLIRKMVLCSTVGKVKEAVNVLDWLNCAKKKDIIGLIEHFMKDVYTDDFYEKAIDIMISMYKNLTDEDLRDLIIRLEAVKDFDVLAQLPQIKMPVLFLGSKADRVFSFEQLKETADAMNCESYFYEGYSHAIYDEAEDIKEKIYEFFMREV